MICPECYDSEEFDSVGDCELCGATNYELLADRAEARAELENERGDWLRQCAKDRRAEEWGTV